MTASRLVALLGLLVSCMADAEDRIVPCENSIHASSIRSLVERGVEASPRFSFTYVPGSGSPERGWVIYRIADRWVLRSVRLKMVVWGNDQWAIPRQEGSGWIEKQLKVREMEVDDMLVETVQNAFRVGINLRSPMPADVIALDGPIVEFAAGWECSQLFSVAENGRAVKLLSALKALEAAPWAWTNAGKRRELVAASVGLIDFAK